MTPPASLSGFVATFCRILGSTVVGEHSVVLEGGEGGIGGLDDMQRDSPGEAITDAETFGAIGLVHRVRPPEKVGDKTLEAQGYAVRTPRGDLPIARRDLRLNRRFPAPKPGTVALVGYGGGFLAFDDASSGASSKATLYVPYGRSDVEATATKAMTIAIDPEQESIMLLHGDGYAVVLDKDNGITLRADASTWIGMKPGKIELVAASISARGNVALGANTATAVPLLPGILSQPTPSVFFSPV